MFLGKLPGHAHGAIYQPLVIDYITSFCTEKSDIRYLVAA